MKIQIFKVEYIAWFNSYYFRKFFYKIKNKILKKSNNSRNGWPADKTIKNILERNAKKYIPLLFYDDLQECMRLNLK